MRVDRLYFCNMPNTNSPPTRSLRSNSNTNTNTTEHESTEQQASVSKDELKTELKEFTDEIVGFFKSEFKNISNQLEALTVRIKTFESNVSEIKTEQARQAAELNELKETVHKINASEIAGEVEDRIRRKNNVILTGVDELYSGNTKEKREHDEKKVKEILNELDLSTTKVKEVVRIGRQQAGVNRIMRVSLVDEDSRKNVLRNAKNLRSNTKYKKTYINPDRTPYEQKLFKACYLEFKERRSKGEDVIIYRGEIVRREAVTNSQDFQ